MSSSNKKLLVIIGVTGSQGGSVASLFCQTPLSTHWRLRGITRDPTSPKPSIAKLRSSGVELVAADLNDPSSLEAAFEGADAIFAVTDFWQFVENDDVIREAKQRSVEVNIVAEEREVQQGKNLVDAAAKAHGRHPLNRLVISTLADSKKLTKGEIKHNHHFDGKAKFVDYLKQTYAEGLTKVTSYLYTGYYLSNAFGFPFWMPYRDGHEVVVRGMAGGQVPFVNPPHDVGYFVQGLIERAPAGTEMLGAAKLMDFEEYVKIFGEVMGVKTRGEVLNGEKELLKEGLPGWLAEEIHDSGRFSTEWGWCGGDSTIKLPEECGVDVSKLTDVGKWIREQDWKL